MFIVQIPCFNLCHGRRKSVCVTGYYTQYPTEGYRSVSQTFLTWLRNRPLSPSSQRIAVRGPSHYMHYVQYTYSNILYTKKSKNCFRQKVVIANNDHNDNQPKAITRCCSKIFKSAEISEFQPLLTQLDQRLTGSEWIEFPSCFSQFFIRYHHTDHIWPNETLAFQSFLFQLEEHT